MPDRRASVTTFIGAFVTVAASLSGCGGPATTGGDPFTVTYTLDGGTSTTVEVTPVDPHCSVFGNLWSYLGTDGDQGVSGTAATDGTADGATLFAQLGDGLVFFSPDLADADADGFVATDLAGRVGTLQDDGGFTIESYDASISGTFTC